MKATHAYVGKHEGKAGYCAAIVDVPGEEKRTAESVAEFIRDGYTVERTTIEDARAGLTLYCVNKAVS
jgi:hypothetical protein